MRVLMISKACVVGTYQRKLEELARYPDLELWLVVPPYWRDGRRVLPLERAHTSGYALRVLPIVLNGNFHLHLYRGLAQILAEVRPEIVHIDEEPYNLATFQAMWLASRHAAKRLFFTWQNLLRRYPFPFSLFERYNLTHTDCAIAGNREAGEVLRAKGYAGPLHFLPQFGVDPEVCRRTSLAGRSRDWFVIGYLGRLVEEKGIHVLLHAAARLEGHWTLRLVGDGPCAAALRELSEELGIQDQVLFEPWAASAQIPDILNELDVLVLPSLTRPNWKEQFGRVLVEAMACEVPVVGSSSGEIPNVIGDAGLVFPEGDVQQLQQMLFTLMKDESLRLELGQRGRARVLDCYTQERIAAQTHAIYLELLGQSGT